MLDTESFGNALKGMGYDFFSGVPCSFLKDLINYAINDCEYIMAANEGDAIAICAGAELAGRKTVALMQNSGLGNAVSPLTSLNAIFKIPVLGFVSLRGEPGLGDEPQHELMGVITDRMLEVMKIRHACLSDSMDEALKQLEEADRVIAAGEAFFFIVKKGSFSKVALKEAVGLVRGQPPAQDGSGDDLPRRYEMIEAIANAAGPSTLIAATTGFTGRELYQHADNESNFYMVGSLGCLSSFCLGVNKARPGQAVIALDGDGAALMRLGALPVVATYKPEKLLHILLDNNAHESTGGQFTVSGNIDWASLARAAGYKQVMKTSNAKELAAAVKSWEAEGGLVFVHARIAQGAPADLGRPKTKPYEVAARLRAFIGRNKK